MFSLGLLSTYAIPPPPRKWPNVTWKGDQFKRKWSSSQPAIFHGNMLVFGPVIVLSTLKGSMFVQSRFYNVICSQITNFQPVHWHEGSPRTAQIDCHILIHRSWFIHQPESLILSGLDSGGYTIFGRSGIELLMLGVNGQAINKSLFTLGQAVKGMGCRIDIEQVSTSCGVNFFFHPFRLMNLQGGGM